MGKLETFILFLILLVLCILRLPIAISLASASIVALWLVDFSMHTVVQKMFSGMGKTTLMAIPGFIFAGLIMANGGISKYLIECMNAWMGHIRGGLSIVTIITCMIFAAISGSSAATAAAIGAVMIPAMTNAGYEKRYTLALIAAAGTLGILIPPSVPLILYAEVTEQSTRELFMAGILPGLLLGTLLIMTAVIIAKQKNYGGLPKVPLKNRGKVTLKAIWGLLLPILILGTIYIGVVTPTEASFLSVAYSLLVSIFIYKEMTIEKFKTIMLGTINTVSMIFLIIAAANIFSMYLTLEQFPQQLAQWVSDLGLSKMGFIIVVSLVVIVLGMFLEATSIILIAVPVILPVLLALDINLTHFAILLVINLELGLITPPVGVNLFVVSGIAKEKVEEVIRGILIFYFVFAMAFLIILFVPQLTTILIK
ncbi:TRAP transporter large permease [Fredinandcohnia onubensis]|uniref:TRAP transporter large permease n=1 Tax=Fredinandcohnia onubensis TaxID=1571209 RepID=UPI001FEBD61C|nr:TRAP transporter large permease [Fredinandcohnia onubensis]